MRILHIITKYEVWAVYIAMAIHVKNFPYTAKKKYNFQRKRSWKGTNDQTNKQANLNYVKIN